MIDSIISYSDWRLEQAIGSFPRKQSKEFTEASLSYHGRNLQLLKLTTSMNHSLQSIFEVQTKWFKFIQGEDNSLQLESFAFKHAKRFFTIDEPTLNKMLAEKNLDLAIQDQKNGDLTAELIEGTTVTLKSDGTFTYRSPQEELKGSVNYYENLYLAVLDNENVDEGTILRLVIILGILQKHESKRNFVESSKIQRKLALIGQELEQSSYNGKLNLTTSLAIAAGTFAVGIGTLNVPSGEKDLMKKWQTCGQMVQSFGQPVSTITSELAHKDRSKGHADQSVEDGETQSSKRASEQQEDGERQLLNKLEELRREDKSIKDQFMR